MCNHHTFLFVGLPLVLRSLWVARCRLRVLGIGIAVALGLIGLTPFAYLLVASASEAAVSWGDQNTLEGIIDHILRRNYGTFSRSWTKTHMLVAHGLVHTISPADKFPTFEEWVRRDKEAMGDYDVTPALLYPENTWEHALGELVLNTQRTRAHIAMVYSIKGNKDPDAAGRCVTLFEDLIAKRGGDEKLSIAKHRGRCRFSPSASTRTHA